MTTLAFINNYFPSLSGTFIYREALGLRKKGIRIKTFSIRQPIMNELSEETLELYNSTTYLLPLKITEFFKAFCYFWCKKPLRCFEILFFLMTRGFDREIKDRIRTFFHYCEGIYFARMVQNNGEIRHIHAHYASHPATVAMVASWLTKIPFSFTAHAYDIWEDRLFVPEKVNAAKFVVTCTEYGKKALLGYQGVNDAKKITTIYHGIDTAKFKRQKNAPERNKVVLLNVGRLHEEKGQNNLIMVCKILKDEGFDFECQIVGDGPAFGDLQQLIETQELRDTVKLVGKVFQEKIMEYYEDADIYVQPSLKENLPNVLLESLAMGVPVIASNIAGIPELIKHNVTGILVQPNDIEQLANAIKLLIRDKEMAQRLGAQGRQWVCENFDIEKSHDRLIEIYRSYGILDNPAVS